MKRKFLVLLVLIVCLFLCSCNKTYYWDFEKPISEVKQISIIYLDGYKFADEVVNMPPIKILDDSLYEIFYSEIKNLEMTKNLEQNWTILVIIVL